MPCGNAVLGTLPSAIFPPGGEDTPVTQHLGQEKLPVSLSKTRALHILSSLLAMPPKDEHWFLWALCKPAHSEAWGGSAYQTQGKDIGRKGRSTAKWSSCCVISSMECRASLYDISGLLCAIGGSAFLPLRFGWGCSTEPGLATSVELRKEGIRKSRQKLAHPKHSLWHRDKGSIHYPSGEQLRQCKGGTKFWRFPECPGCS